MNQKELEQLATGIHIAAVEKGFYSVTEDADDLKDIMIASIHCELSEALQEDRHGSPMVYVDDITLDGRIEDIALFDGRKPEGVAVELADFVIRLLDYAVGFKQDLSAYSMIKYYGGRKVIRKADLPTLIVRLHSMVVDVEGDSPLIGGAIRYVEHWLDYRGIDLWEIVRIKREYNESRPRLHGKRY